MKALVYKASGCNVEDKLVPELSVNSVLIELKYSAICRTDLYVARGSIPTQEGRIFGHEASGVIVDIGHKVDVKLKGKKVAIIPLRGCGKCLNCNTSHMHLCSEHQFMGIDYDGVFAEYLVLPSSEVIVVPNDLDRVHRAFSCNFRCNRSPSTEAEFYRNSWEWEDSPVNLRYFKLPWVYRCGESRLWK